MGAIVEEEEVVVVVAECTLDTKHGDHDAVEELVSAEAEVGQHSIHGLG